VREGKPCDKGEIMKNVRLLIVDDNPQILQVLSNLLSDEFCTVGTVSDGKSLIAAAAALYPHIIITDIPTITGLDMVLQLEAVVPDTKIMVLTDHEEPAVATAALAAGASAVLFRKGVTDLRSKIRAIIQDLLTACPKRLTAVSQSTRSGSQGVLQYS
jgi:DNA-binding NarL/FixJ family response regulator